MKRLIIAAAVGVSLLLLFIQSNWVGSLFTRAAATLTVQNEHIPLALYIDNQLSGTLPLRELSISPGVHTFTLRNIKGEDAVNVFWQGELEVNPADAVVITVVSAQENRIDGIVVTRFFSSNTQQSFSRIFMEQQATLYINDQKFEKTPVVVDDSELSGVTIRTEHPIYTDIQFSFTKKQNTSFSTHIYLQYDYVQNIVQERVDVGSASNNDFGAVRRWDWQSTQRPLPVEQFGEKRWDNIRVYSVVVPDFISSQKALQGIENQFVDLNYAPRIPFCFVIDPSSAIWEGFGVWDYDFSLLGIQSLRYNGGECPILVIKASKDQQVPGESLARIRQFISQPAQHAAAVQDAFEVVSLKDQERALVDVAITNTGWSTWHPQDGEEIALVLTDSTRSAVFDQENWLNLKTANRITDPLVIPGGETSLAIPLKAPMYSLRYAEKFALAFGENTIPGTAFELPIQIEGVGPPVEVAHTPGGYLNVYESDSEDTRLLTSLFEGEKHALLERKGNWVQIRLPDGRDGWVQAQYLGGL